MKNFSLSFFILYISNNFFKHRNVKLFLYIFLYIKKNILKNYKKYNKFPEINKICWKNKKKNNKQKKRYLKLNKLLKTFIFFHIK